MDYRIAVTSSDGIHVDQHFGRAADFLVLRVRAETGETQSEGRRAVPQADDAVRAESAVTGHDCIGGDLSRLEETGQMLSDCRYVLTSAIGRRPQSVLLHHGVSALETDGEVTRAVAALNRYVSAGPAVGSTPSCRLGA